MNFILFASEQWILFSVLLLLIYAFVWRESTKGGKSLSHHELTRMLNADEAVVLDVRDQKDFSAGHIAGAVNIPFAKLTEREAELAQYKSDRAIVVVDKAGQHAGTAGKNLVKLGYTVNRLSGGMTDWLNDKLPVVKK